jgi:HlyD family secretion protein
VDGAATDRQRTQRGTRSIATLGLCLVGAIIVTLALARARGSLPIASRQETVLAKVTRGSLVQTVSGPGHLVPRHVRWLTATHRARIEQVLVEPGDRVEPNTVVAVLENPEMDLLLLDAQQKLATAQIQVAESRRQLDAATDQAGLELASAREQGRLALGNQQRLSQLSANGIATESDLDQAESRQRELDERARRLEQRESRAGRERSAELEPGSALVASLQRIVARRKLDLEELRLTSGARGVVHSVSMEPGQWVEAGTLLAKLIVTGELDAELDIDELDARDVGLGQAASIAFGSARLPGHVSRVDPMASRGQVKVLVSLDRLDPGLRADQRISGDVEIRHYADALSLDTPVRVTRAGHFILYKRIGPNTLAAVDTELSPTLADRVLVKSGLAEGEEVAISDMERFKDHDRVELR